MEKKQANPLMWILFILILFWLSLSLVLKNMDTRNMETAGKVCMSFSWVFLLTFIAWFFIERFFDKLKKDKIAAIGMVKKVLLLTSIVFLIFSSFFWFSWVVKNVFTWIFSFTKNDFVEIYNFFHWFFLEG